MAKNNSLLKRTTNSLLNQIADMPLREALPTESELARMFGVSRTTIRSALRHIEKKKIVERTGQQLTVRRRPSARDHFADAQTVGPQQRVEQMLMERMLRGGWAQGFEFTESDLARDCGVSTATVREFLINFSRYRLIEKRSGGGWRLLGLDAGFANEVADMRQLIEMAAIQQLLPNSEEEWDRRIDDFLERHHELKRTVDENYLDFPVLDRELHTFFISGLKNRFASHFMEVITFTFHYHYAWTSEGQKLRVMSSLDEHIAILNALRDKNMLLARELLAAHLATARKSLVTQLAAASPASHPAQD